MREPHSLLSIGDAALAASPAERDARTATGAPPAPLALGVLVSGRGSNLQAILDAIDRGELAAGAAVVVSNRPGVLALTRAEQCNVPTAVHERRDFPSRRARDQAILHTLRSHNVELVVNAGYSAILHRSVVAAYRDRIINIHPSLLPAFAGGMDPKPQADALAAGVKIAGCTVHVVTEDVDAGPIIAQAAVPVLDDDTTETLAARILAEEHRLLPAVIGWFAAEQLQVTAGRVRGTPPATGWRPL